MSAVALLNLKAGFSGDEVVISWKYPPNAPDTVFAYPIHSSGATRRVVASAVRQWNLRDAASGVRLKYSVSSHFDVARCEFLVFLADDGGTHPDLDRLAENPAFTVTLTAGQAKISYSIKSKKVENGFEKHIITLHSANSIEQGILGYSFFSAGRQFSATFPDVIKRGKCKYPPFLTKVGEGVAVCVVNGENPNILIIRR
ncbi:MAG: hypothetical protein FWE34_04665 [Defluviitaleaceae bacterium]|nr:hypothetical protein [Defluviitaleaceae bacterium]